VDDGIDESAADITAVLTDGRRVQVRVEHAIGSLQNPMTDAQLEAKFHGLSDAVSIAPVLSPDGQVIYLSTDGVATAALAAGGGVLGKVAVVAHRDHAKRCVKVSRAAGMEAFVAADIPLPADYDLQSGQAWTRSREVYLLHDLAAQFMGLRAEAIGRTGG